MTEPHHEASVDSSTHQSRVDNPQVLTKDMVGYYDEWQFAVESKLVIDAAWFVDEEHRIRWIMSLLAGPLFEDVHDLYRRRGEYCTVEEIFEKVAFNFDIKNRPVKAKLDFLRTWMRADESVDDYYWRVIRYLHHAGYDEEEKTSNFRSRLHKGIKDRLGHYTVLDDLLDVARKVELEDACRLADLSAPDDSMYSESDQDEDQWDDEKHQLFQDIWVNEDPNIKVESGPGEEDDVEEEAEEEDSVREDADAFDSDASTQSTPASNTPNPIQRPSAPSLYGLNYHEERGIYCRNCELTLAGIVPVCPNCQLKSNKPFTILVNVHGCSLEDHIGRYGIFFGPDSCYNYSDSFESAYYQHPIVRELAMQHGFASAVRFVRQNLNSIICGPTPAGVCLCISLDDQFVVHELTEGMPTWTWDDRRQSYIMPIGAEVSCSEGYSEIWSELQEAADVGIEVACRLIDLRQNSDAERLATNA